MTKHGNYLRFGYALRLAASDPARTLALAVRAEQLGLDYLAIQSQPDDATLFDPWTLITALGLKTARIALVANGSQVPSRSPAQFAKAAATLDLLAKGRLHLALGQEMRGAEKVAALRETIQAMRGAWSGDSAAGADGLAPADPIDIWLCGDEPDVLALAGGDADGWIGTAYPQVQPGDLATLCRQVDDAATSAKRDLSALQRVWSIGGTIGDQDHSDPFQGSAKQWAETLANLAMEVGIDTFMLLEGENAEDQLERFAEEVMPATRALVKQMGGLAFPGGLANARQGAKASGPTPLEEAAGKLDEVDESSMESFPASDPPASNSFT